MKKRLLFLALAASFVLLPACSASDDSPSSTPTSDLLTESAQVESEPPRSTAKEDITEYLSELGYEVVTARESSTMIEFMLTQSGFSDQDLSVEPENWEEIHASLLDAEQGAKEFSPDLPVILYLQDNDGNNYLTVADGKEKYSAFKTYSSSGYNPPTITMEEYNAIKTGMTFQEVYDIVGGPGEVSSEVDLGLGEEHHTIMRKWDGEGSIGANAIITFRGGKVTSKAQFGLE